MIDGTGPQLFQIFCAYVGGLNTSMPESCVCARRNTEAGEAVLACYSLHLSHKLCTYRDKRASG